MHPSMSSGGTIARRRRGEHVTGARVKQSIQPRPFYDDKTGVGTKELIFVQSHIDFYIYLEPCARAPEKRAGISPSLVHDWGKFEAAGLSTNTVASQYLHEAFRAL